MPWKTRIIESEANELLRRNKIGVPTWVRVQNHVQNDVQTQVQNYVQNHVQNHVQNPLQNQNLVQNHVQICGRKNKI